MQDIKNKVNLRYDKTKLTLQKNILQKRHNFTRKIGKNLLN